MSIILPLLTGFISAAVGIAPPGLINMTAAKVSVKEGRDQAVFFIIGATIICFFQTLIALLFAKFIYSRPDVINLLQEVGLFIFMTLTFYFFWKAGRPKKPKTEIKLRSKKDRFFLGMLLSLLNMFPVPYYIFISISLSSYGYFFFDKPFVYTFVLGAVVGSYLMFYSYILFFKKQEEGKPSFFMNNGNYIIGSVTGIISLITIFKLIKPYFL